MAVKGVPDFVANLFVADWSLIAGCGDVLMGRDAMVV